MPTSTPPTVEVLDQLEEALREGGTALADMALDVDVVAGLIAAARRIEPLERLVAKLATQTRPETTLLLLPAEAAEYDALMARAMANVVPPAPAEVGP